MKYIVVYTCPICSNGASTGFAPIHVKIVIILTIIQNFVFICVVNFVDFFFVFTITVRIIIDATKAMTPPSFDGIDRKITYANRKYHSG